MVSTRSVAVDPSGSCTDEADPDDRGQQQRERLAEHGRLRLDPADAPAEHAQPVDHRRVRVGPDERVRVRAPVVVDEHDTRQVLEVDLVADAGVGGHDSNIGERVLRPPQQLVALAVAGELQFGVATKRVGATRYVGDDRVVDDQLDGHARVDLGRICPEGFHRVAHRGQIDDGGHAGEVLHEDTGGAKAISRVPADSGCPAGEGFDVGLASPSRRPRGGGGSRGAP